MRIFLAAAIAALLLAPAYAQQSPNINLIPELKSKTPEEKENRLTAACSAWNMACGTPEECLRLLDQYVEGYKRFNPATPSPNRNTPSPWKTFNWSVRTDLRTSCTACSSQYAFLLELAANST